MGRVDPFRAYSARKAPMSKSTVPFISDEVSSDLGDVCFVLGALSIAASIAVWAKAKGVDKAHGERFGIFVGLWAPAFFILSDRRSRKR